MLSSKFWNDCQGLAKVWAKISRPSEVTICWLLTWSWVAEGGLTEASGVVGEVGSDGIRTLAFSWILTLTMTAWLEVAASPAGVIKAQIMAPISRVFFIGTLLQSIKKKPGALSRQPGYLPETRGFPSPPYNGFGNLSGGNYLII
jgi:hypothetical protein